MKLSEIVEQSTLLEMGSGFLLELGGLAVILYANSTTPLNEMLYLLGVTSIVVGSGLDIHALRTLVNSS